MERGRRGRVAQGALTDGVDVHEVEALLERGTIADLPGYWPDADLRARAAGSIASGVDLSLIHISEPTRPY